MHRIAGVVVLYNPSIDVSFNIASYAAEIEMIYMVDNSEVTNQEVKAELLKFKNGLYISNEGNKGIATALNKAALLALRNGFSHLLTMDQDSSFPLEHSGKLIKSLDEVKKLKVGILAPLHHINNAEIIIPPGKFLEVRGVMTSGNLLNLKAFADIGKFEEKLFIDYIDHEYCLRLRKSEYLIIQCNDVYLNHKLGNTTRHSPLKITATHHNYIRRYYITRNRLYVAWKYKFFDPKYGIQELVYFFSEFIKIVLVEKNKLLKAKSVIMGIRDFIIGRYGKYEG